MCDIYNIMPYNEFPKVLKPYKANKIHKKACDFKRNYKMLMQVNRIHRTNNIMDYLRGFEHEWLKKL